MLHHRRPLLREQILRNVDRPMLFHGICSNRSFFFALGRQAKAYPIIMQLLAVQLLFLRCFCSAYKAVIYTGAAAYCDTGLTPHSACWDAAEWLLGNSSMQLSQVFLNHTQMADADLTGVDVFVQPGGGGGGKPHSFYSRPGSMLMTTGRSCRSMERCEVIRSQNPEFCGLWREISWNLHRGLPRGEPKSDAGHFWLQHASSGYRHMKRRRQSLRRTNQS